MKIVIIIVIILVNVFELSAQNFEKINESNTQKLLNSIKKERNKYCLKCGSQKSASKLKEVAVKLEQFLDENPQSKYWYEAKELLGYTYSELSIGFHKSSLSDKARKEYDKKHMEIFNQLIEEERFTNPDIVFRATAFNKDDKIRRDKLLKRILYYQSHLYRAKNWQGYILLEKGKIKEALKSFEIAVYLANYADAQYGGEDLAALLMQYDRKDLAMVILKKAFPKIQDEKKIEKMLEGME